jgi:anti-sigma28 factor (negative regulator of flagellin synthesis)
MKIDNHSLGQAQALPSPIGASASTTGKTGSSGRKSGDQVQISDMATLLSTDPEKLAQLTAAVQDGIYNVSSSQIAASIVNELSQA